MCVWYVVRRSRSNNEGIAGSSPVPHASLPPQNRTCCLGGKSTHPGASPKPRHVMLRGHTCMCQASQMCGAFPKLKKRGISLVRVPCLAPPSKYVPLRLVLASTCPFGGGCKAVACGL
jgi:hypothetical protein